MTISTGTALCKTLMGGILYGSVLGLTWGPMFRNDPKKSILVGIVLTTICIASINFVGKAAFYAPTLSLPKLTFGYQFGVFEDIPVQRLFLRHFGL